MKKLLTLALLVGFVGCGPEEKVEEEVAEKGKGGTPNTKSVDTDSPVFPDDQSEFFRLGCQGNKAEQIEGQGAMDRYVQQATNEGRTVVEVLSEQGYDCTNEELIEFQGQG